MVTAFATTETAIAAMKAGAYDYLTKPFKIDEVSLVVDRALERRALARDNLALRDEIKGRYRLDRLLGKSPPMQRVFDTLQKDRPGRASVLLIGESGTGKELAARALHELSQRADRPFVAVNCGAIPETLLESELFGHVKGSFTGAHADKQGLFEAAHSGTLLLDEVAELPVAMQVKLLRVLQERKVKPVGGVAEREVDVRIVAATNRDLETEVEKGTFRQDLFYRLGCHPAAPASLARAARGPPAAGRPLPAQVLRRARAPGGGRRSRGHAGAHGLPFPRQRARVGESHRTGRDPGRRRPPHYRRLPHPGRPVRRRPQPDQRPLGARERA